MKKGWEVKKLGEVCNIVGGGTPSKSIIEYYGGDIPWATVRDMNSDVISTTEHKITVEAVKNSATNIIPKDNIVIATRVGLGKVCLLEKDTAINQDLKGIIPKTTKTVFIPYLYHWLKSVGEYIKKNGTGATVQGVKLSFIESLLIPLPPISEQQRIVANLDEAFSAIGKAKENAEKNLNNARELFDSYLQSVFANPGDGWEEKKLGEVCFLRSGTTLPVVLEKPTGDLAYLKVADMNLRENLDLITTSSRFVDNSDVAENGIIPIGSTIFPKRGGAIFTNKKRLTSVAICMDLNLMAVTPKKELIPEFVYYYFLKLDLRQINNGSSIPQINNYSIAPLIISFPKSLSIQKKIVDKLDALSAETKKLEAIYEQKLADLEELKQSILEKAFKGEL